MVLSPSAAGGSSQHRSFQFYAAVGLVTASTLMLQVIQTRILSVVAWYYLAFVVISLAMFGLTAGGVWAYMNYDRYKSGSLFADLRRFSLFYAAAIPLCLAVQMAVPAALPSGVMGHVLWFTIAVLVGIPFILSGIIVSLALTRSPWPTARVYGFDLIGAAAGCFGVIGLLNWLDAPSAVLFTAVLPALAAILFGRLDDVGVVTAGPLKDGLLVCALGAVALMNGALEPAERLRPVFAKETLEVTQPPPIFEEWNSFSRVTLRHLPEIWPRLRGASPRWDPLEWAIAQQHIRIDGDAGTPAYALHGDFAKAGFLRYDITNLAYHLGRRGDVAVIGVGAGRDLVSAHIFGARSVTGIELNPLIVRLLRDPDRLQGLIGLDKIPNLRLFVGEARNWLARHRQNFDFIQMSLVDTWAATGAGAFSLSENSLYTVEGWGLFLSRLDPGGIFTVSRWFDPAQPAESGRLLSLAVASLFRSGVRDPRQHIFMAVTARISTLIVAKDPLTEEELAVLERTCRDLAFDILASPRHMPQNPVLGRIFAASSPAGLDAYTSGLPFDLTPTTDERPFFFNQLPLGTALAALVAANSDFGSGIRHGNLQATRQLMALLMISVILVLLAIISPARRTLAAADRPLVLAGSSWFLLIGFGFMLIEVAFLQRISMFLGNPVYALSVVLFTVVFMAGLGSLAADRFALDTTRRIGVWALMIAIYALVLKLWLPGLLASLEELALPLRIVLAVAIITPMSFLLGFGFPTGMRLVAAISERPLPWFWGINGAAGAVGSIVAVALSIEFGIGTTLLIGGLAYLGLIAAAAALSRLAESGERASARTGVRRWQAVPQEK